MNFIEVTTENNERVLLNISYILDVVQEFPKDGKGRCSIYATDPGIYYEVKESYEEIKMKLLRFAGIG